MKLFLLAAVIFTLTLNLIAQKPDEILATAGDQSFSAANLPGDSAKIWSDQSKMVASARTQALVQMVTEILIDTEAKARNLTPEKLFDEVRSKVPDPTAEEVQKIYDANKATIGEKTLAEIKPQIVEFLRGEPEQKALQAYVKTLETKYGVKFGRDINSPDLKSMEAVVTINGKSASVQEFEDKARFNLYDVRAEIYDEVKAGLDDVIFSVLVAEEARARNMDTGELMAREITDKLKDFTEEERGVLQVALQKRLFEKYNVKFMLKEPPPIVQNVSVDDDPSRGLATAPVTVVMFSDFQCSACSATHPVLKKVIAEYGDKVRLVVRDFPLVQVHENAMQAARAAGAANAQGKFFEYTEVLYRNQKALDPASLRKYASDLGLNLKQFELDLASEKTAAEINKDIADGNLYGVGGTPTIFVNGIKVRGLTAARFREAIDRALKK
jgi:protein-disulfide isomerase